jgi:kexin
MSEGIDPENPFYTYSDGTSMATPHVSGVVALMLQAKPGLGWRDVRLILAETARRNDPTDPDWSPNGAGRFVNHKYGFGVVDAQAAVARALTWTNVGPEVTPFSAGESPEVPIPDNDAAGVSHTITITGSGIAQIEYVEVPFTSNHEYSGDLEVTLTSPAGTASRLAEQHFCSGPCTLYNGWVFGSARHLGEAADGNWTLTVKDRAPSFTGTFQSWQLKFYGR